jgi:hypothetical protein
MTGTERLTRFIREYIEEKLKPEGMTSGLFWEIYDLISEKETKDAKSNAFYRRFDESSEPGHKSS